MSLEATPRLDGRASEAVRVALMRAGVSDDSPPETYTSPWRRAAAYEAVGYRAGGVGALAQGAEERDGDSGWGPVTNRRPAEL
jgi:hypothetical protein